MHNMGKTIGELHALLIEYMKGLPKKAATPQVMVIQGGRIQKANKKSLNAKGKGKGKDKSYIPKPKNPKPYAKEHPAKDDACHHCKEVGHCKRNFPAYLDELIRKKNQVGTTNSSVLVSKNNALYFNVILSDGIYEIDMLNLVPNVNSISTIILLGLCSRDYYTHSMVPTKKVDKKPYESWYGKVPNLSYLKVWGCEALVKRDTPDKLQQKSVKYTEFLEKNLLSQEVSGRAEELEEIQNKDTSPSENTSEIPMEVEGFEPPQEEGKYASFKDPFMVLSKHQEAGIKDLMRKSKGSIMYAVRCTRPDVAFAQNLTNHFQQHLGEPHWAAVKTILKYLRITKDMFLVYGVNPEAELRVNCYCNAGFKTDRDDIKSQTRYLNNIAALEAAMEVVWIRKFISGLEENLKLVAFTSPASLPSFSIKDIASGSVVSQGCPRLNKVIHGVFQSALWAIWNWRNRVVNSPPDGVEGAKEEDIFPTIQRISKTWISARYSLQLISWSCWITNLFRLFT
ncbi:hypothetical protein Tco_0723759 [Tanacetum coccineum]